MNFILCIITGSILLCAWRHFHSARQREKVVSIHTKEEMEMNAERVFGEYYVRITQIPVKSVRRCLWRGLTGLADKLRNEII